MKDILVESIMTKKVICTSSETEISEIIHTLQNRSFSCIVITKGKIPIGIITERDIVRIFADVLDDITRQIPKASEVMSSPPITVNEKEQLINTIAIARSQGIRHLIVVNSQGELTGIVTQSDLFRTYFHMLQRKSKE